MIDKKMIAILDDIISEINNKLDGEIQAGFGLSEKSPVSMAFYGTGTTHLLPTKEEVGKCHIQF